MKKNYRLLIFLIKSSRILVFAWAAAAMAAYFLFVYAAPPFRDYPALIFLYVFAVFLLYLLPLTLVTKKQYKKIEDTLFIRCDPFAYIDIYRRIIGELAKTKSTKPLDYYRLNLSAGLMAAGRYVEAYESLGRFKSFKSNRIGKISNVVYYNNLCSVCLKLGRTDEAKHYFDCLVCCAAALSPKDHQKYIKYVDLAGYGVNMAMGIFNNAEDFYNGIFNKAASNYERVGAKFCLGRVHLHFGDTAKAEEAFEYVISNGNKLHAVEEAKEFLNQIS